MTPRPSRRSWPRWAVAAGPAAAIPLVAIPLLAGPAAASPTATGPATVAAPPSAATSRPGTKGSPPAATDGAAYSYQFTLTGTPTPTVTATGLPAGLVLSASGLLSGTPAATGTFKAVVTAANGVGADTHRTVKLTVKPGPAASIITNGSGGTAAPGQTFAGSLTASVADDEINPVPGAKVRFTVESGSATFAGGASSATVTADGGGTATAPTLTAGPTVGAVDLAVTSGSATPGLAAFTVAPSSPSADISIAFDSAASVARGSSFPATVVVTNAGPAAASGMVAQIAIPPQLDVVSAPGATISGAILTWTAPSVAASSSVTFPLQLSVSSAPDPSGYILVPGDAASGTHDPKTNENTDLAVLTETS